MVIADPETADLPDLPRPFTVAAGLPNVPLTGVVRGIIALIPARGIIDTNPALDIIEAVVARGFTAAGLFLPMADPGGEATAKEGPYGPGETPRGCSMITIWEEI